ncbi:MAG: aminotransferase class I/II-fold pyridoxal phosphate-dependent enzyme [Coriobacteriia bacterium]|nr:aminotransferase class I/II-fold pyridoxal phosphate-dependent enzyme [Coriobacteriia bacterium]
MDWDGFFRDNLTPVMAYQPGLREEQIREKVEVDSIYKLSSNESPLPPFPSALAAIQERLALLNEYPEGSCYRLVQLLSQHYGIPAEQVIVGNGSNELIDLIATTCLEPGDNVVYCWPSFVVYRSSAQIAGAQRREVPLAADGSFDLAALLAAIDEKTKLVFICTPNNPTGAAVGRAAFEAFLEQVPSHVLVVVDAAYEEFLDDEQADGQADEQAVRPADGQAVRLADGQAVGQAVRLADGQAVRPLDYYDGVRPYVVLRTFSKIYALAGLRCGYGFAPAPLVDMLHKVREPFNVNTLSQVAAEACFEDIAEIQKRVALNAAGKKQLQACFEKLGLVTYPSQANFIWVEVPDPPATFEALLKKGVIVRPFPGAQGLRVGIGDAQGVAATICAFTELFG